MIPDKMHRQPDVAVILSGLKDSRHTPPPSADDAGGDDETSDADSEDRDAQRAAGVSAMKDFAKALGLKDADAEKAYDAFCELQRHHTEPDEDDEEEPSY